MALLDSIKPLGPVPVRINFEGFLDRAAVKAVLDEKTRRSLIKCGLIIMQNARRSIKKMGMAKPKLKEQTTYEGASLQDLLTFGDNMVSKRAKNRIRDRLFEIRFRPPSRPGTPPHTHLNTLRNSITFEYDQKTESVVVGGFMDGIERVVSLHEFGGMQSMSAWAWIPEPGRSYRRGIIGYWAIGRKPRLNPGRWEEMGPQWRKTFNYPARPYMKPAMLKAIKEKEIVRQFKDRIRIGG
ncbi:MAG: hypothetical protein KGR24_03310 [Planctomycetes bacterium]|nr:hypothetical protein [Planctomycetota bacterium]